MLQWIPVVISREVGLCHFLEFYQRNILLLLYVQCTPTPCAALFLCLPCFQNFRVVTNGPGALIYNNASLYSNTSGPYPIQRDACTGWSGSESVLAKAGLLKLFAQA